MKNVSIQLPDASKINNDKSLIHHYLRTREQTLLLCHPLSNEDYSAQPVVDVSPPKWHLAHTTWFFETFILKPFKKNYKLFDKNFAFLFNSYYESFGDRLKRNERGSLNRPCIDEVYKYRRYVDNEMSEFLDSVSLYPKIVELIALGINHEQQHQELLVTDIKFIFGHNPLFPVYLVKPQKSGHFNTEKLYWLEADEGIYPIGYSGKGFCFDNEKGRHKTFLHRFRVSDRLITNGEYLEFMMDGGYKNHSWWLMDGWDWINQNKIDSPLYWHKSGNTWNRFSVHGMDKVHADEPVSHISYYEADAYAKWAGKRLPTEQELEVITRLHGKGKQANLQSRFEFEPLSAKASNNFQLIGDLWEWTSSAYLPYPNFRQGEGAAGEYNGKFMINQMVLRGGSCATPDDHIRPTYRNFFQPDKRWQFSGIRLAEHF